VARIPGLVAAAKCASHAGEENMGQRPLIKDGVVVNVIEIEDDTLPCTKARHKELAAIEQASYEAKFNAWRKVVMDHRQAILQARQAAFLAHGVLNALKVQAEAEKAKPKWKRLLPSAYTSRISDAERQVADANRQIAELEALRLPEKPKPVRSKRWIHPDGHEVGARGGNIGDRWDGKKYTRPPKAA
jgi:hypothetical protein